MKDRRARLRKILADGKAQDMVEYALLAGFTAVTIGATLPGIGKARSQDRQEDRAPFSPCGRHFF